MKEFWTYGNWEGENPFGVKTWIPSAPSGRGIIRQFTIRQGMTLSLQNLSYHRAHESQLSPNDTALTFYYCFSGIESLQDKKSKQRILFDQGAAGVFIQSSDSSYTSQIPGQTPICVLSIQITPECFWDMELAKYPTLLNCFTRIEDSRGFSNLPFPLTRGLQGVAEQLLHSPHNSPAAPLYIEGKCLEFIAGMIDALENLKTSTKQEKNTLCPREMELVHNAKKILARHLDSPPTLDALARHTGMNHVKLNRGFKALYGTTVFGLLRELRLEKAKNLLLSGEMNVTEASYSVGYSSLSHFSRIFKAHHGFNPGDCLKRHTQV